MLVSNATKDHPSSLMTAINQHLHLRPQSSAAANLQLAANPSASVNAMEPYHAPQDEGYSEDPLTSRSVVGTSSQSLMDANFARWLANMPVEDRARMLSSPNVLQHGL